MASNSSSSVKLGRMSSLPTFSPPDLAPLTIHVLNSSSVEDTGVQKSVNMLQEALFALVTSLQKQFEAIENVMQQQPVSSDNDGEQGNNARNTRLGGASTSLYDITAEVVQLSAQAEKTLPRLTAVEEQCHESLDMIRKLISASEEAEAEVQDTKNSITKLEDRSTDLEHQLQEVFPPLQFDLVKINAALELSDQKTIEEPSPPVTVPWRAPLSDRISSLEAEIEDLHKKMRLWSEGCEDLMIKTQRERIDDVEQNKHHEAKNVSFQKSAFGGDLEAVARGWKQGEFTECDLGLCLNYLLSMLSSFSTTEEMIRQWEVVHELIETKIEGTVHAYIDTKLSNALRDPEQKEHALRLVHALSPDAAYRNILTQLDFKVDKQVFHTLSSRVFEQLDGVAKLSALHGKTLHDLSNGAQRAPRLTDLTTAHPIRSIQHTSVSKEAFTQAHFRLPRPSGPPASRQGIAGVSLPVPPRHAVSHPSTPRSSVTWAPEMVTPPVMDANGGRRGRRPVSART